MCLFWCVPWQVSHRLLTSVRNTVSTSADWHVGQLSYVAWVASVVGPFDDTAAAFVRHTADTIAADVSVDAAASDSVLFTAALNTARALAIHDVAHDVFFTWFAQLVAHPAVRLFDGHGAGSGDDLRTFHRTLHLVQLWLSLGSGHPHLQLPQHVADAVARSHLVEHPTLSTTQLDVFRTVTRMCPASPCVAEVDSGPPHHFSLDMAWPDKRVAIEVDGPSHFVAPTMRSSALLNSMWFGARPGRMSVAVPLVRWPSQWAPGDDPEAELFTRAATAASSAADPSTRSGRLPAEDVAAVLVNSGFHLNGPTMLKRRLLRLSGWTVHSVPVLDWAQLPDDAQCERYLQDVCAGDDVFM